VGLFDGTIMLLGVITAIHERQPAIVLIGELMSIVIA
jgi:hypothetical protein